MSLVVDSLNKVQDSYNIQLPDEDSSLSDFETDSACLGILQLPDLFKHKMMSTAAQDGQDCIILLVGNAASYSPSVMALDVETGETEIPTDDGASEYVKSEGVVSHVQKVLQRQISIHLGGKFMLHLIEHFLMLLKVTSRDNSATERAHEAPNNRWRRYKRSASFDSRKVDYGNLDTNLSHVASAAYRRRLSTQLMDVSQSNGHKSSLLANKHYPLLLRSP